MTEHEYRMALLLAHERATHRMRAVLDNNWHISKAAQLSKLKEVLSDFDQQAEYLEADREAALRRERETEGAAAT